MLNLTSLRLFVDACEAGSLSKVSDANNMALAAVSRRISLLEAEYGIALLTRTPRGVVPTSAGRALLSRARDIFRQVSLTHAELEDYAKGVRGRLSLWASTSAITQTLPADLARFSTQYSDIRLDIREAYTAEIAANLREGLADVGVVMAGPSIIGLSALPYRRDRLALIAPADFRSGVTSLRFSDVVNENFVLMEDNTVTTRLLLSKAAEAGSVLRLRVQVDSFDAVCRMVQSGFGIGVLPAGSAKYFAQALGLRMIELEEPWAERQMMICTSPVSDANLAVATLVGFLVDAAAQRE